MNTSALILMSMTMILVIMVTATFFYKVLKSPPKPEPDSFDENDDEPRN